MSFKTHRHPHLNASRRSLNEDSEYVRFWHGLTFISHILHLDGKSVLHFSFSIFMFLSRCFASLFFAMLSPVTSTVTAIAAAALDFAAATATVSSYWPTFCFWHLLPLLIAAIVIKHLGVWKYGSFGSYTTYCIFCIIWRHITSHHIASHHIILYRIAWHRVQCTRSIAFSSECRVCFESSK